MILAKRISNSDVSSLFFLLFAIEERWRVVFEIFGEDFQPLLSELLIAEWRPQFQGKMTKILALTK